MAQETRAITAEELFRMPDDGYKYELVAGRLRKMTPAGSIHGVVSMRLAVAISVHVDQHQLGVVFAADTGFKLARAVRIRSVHRTSRSCRVGAFQPGAFRRPTGPALRIWRSKCCRPRM